jgi:hypothetical protein
VRKTDHCYLLISQRASVSGKDDGDVAAAAARDDTVNIEEQADIAKNAVVIICTP